MPRRQTQARQIPEQVIPPWRELIVPLMVFNGVLLLLLWKLMDKGDKFQAGDVLWLVGLILFANIVVILFVTAFRYGRILKMKVGASEGRVDVDVDASPSTGDSR